MKLVDAPIFGTTPKLNPEPTTQVSRQAKYEIGGRPHFYQVTG